VWLDDIRKNKMITESGQILSTCMNTMVPDHKYDVYKSFNPKHGSNVWVTLSSRNFMWLIQHAEAMIKQRGNRHGAAPIIAQARGFWTEFYNLWPDDHLTPFSNNAANDSLGISFKHIADTNLAYRMYSDWRWQRDTIKLTWNHGREPWWRTK
jgi:hypothetical protein